MTHEPPRQGSHAAALQTKKPSLLSDGVSLRIRRRCHKRLKPLDIPAATTDDTKDAVSFRWWALPAASAPVDSDTQQAAPDAIVSINLVPPSLASLAASLTSLDCSSLAAGLSQTASTTRCRASCPSTLL